VQALVNESSSLALICPADHPPIPAAVGG
jgi:hypothetical protein